jgi:hypothetical protein
MKLSLILVVLFLFCIDHSKADGSARERSSVGEKSDVFQTYFDYFDFPQSKYIDIETPWLRLNSKVSETERGVLDRVESLLLRELSFEVNDSGLRSAIIQQSMLFQRQVVCDKFRTDLTGEFHQTVTNSTNEGQKVFSRMGHGSRRSNLQMRELNEGYAWSKQVANEARSDAFGEATFDTYQIEGHTVIKTDEKIFETFCIEKHLEFRGKLIAETILKSVDADQSIKTYLVRKGLKNISEDFNRRIIRWSSVFKSATHGALSQLQLQEMGFNRPADLASYLQFELTSLVATQIYFMQVTGLFRSSGVADFASLIEAQATDMARKLSILKDGVAIYSSPYLSVAMQSAGGGEEQLLFTEEALALIFKDFNGFVFRGEMLNPMSLQRISNLTWMGRNQR